MQEIHGKQTGVYIKSLVLADAALCGISQEKMYTVTTDGESNQVKFCNMLFDEQERETNDPYDYDELIESVATGEDSDRFLIESLESIEFNSLDDNPAVPVNTELLAQYWANVGEPRI